MTDTFGRGRYAKVFRGMKEDARALETVANRLLAEKDAEIASLTAERDRYKAALTIISGSSDRLRASQAICALDNIGPDTH